ncbi:MAG TPA: hypothetical protein VMY34_09510, partial [Acidimicrobiales bacterium]|nr:hypothetical protein [Acidimicrobiales bacterium]
WANLHGSFAVGVAVLGVPVLRGDDIAALLAIDEPPLAPELWPTPDEIRRFRRVAARLGRDRVRRLVTDAVGPRDGALNRAGFDGDSAIR